MSNSRHATNKTRSVLVLGHGLIEKINDSTIYAEKMYLPNFTVDNKIFCLSLDYNGDNSYSFVNGEEVTKFKAKISELMKYRMCLGGLSKDYDRNIGKNTGLSRKNLRVLMMLLLYLLKEMITEFIFGI